MSGRNRGNSTATNKDNNNNKQKGSSFLSGMFGWMGGSSSRGPTQTSSGLNNSNHHDGVGGINGGNDDRVSDLYALKHDPSTFLMKRSATEANIDVVQTTNMMKKSWHQYESMENEKQVETLTNLVKNFPFVCHKCDATFQSIFGDGQMFVVALNVKFLTDTELLLTHSPHADRLMWRPLVDFFFDPSQIGCEILDTLTVISEKLSLLTLMSQTQLSSCLIRYLDAFYHVPFSLLVDNASHPQLVTQERLRSIQKAIAFLVRRVVRLPMIPADIMNTDSMSTVTNILKSKDGPPENQHIKSMMMEILGDILQNANAPFVEYLHKKAIVTSLLNSLKHTTQDEAQHIALIIEAIVLFLKKTTLRDTNQIVKDFSNANGYQIVQDAILECEETFEEDFDGLRKLFKLTADLVFVGEGYVERSEGKQIKSQGAFQAIANTFARAKHDTLRTEVVDNILFIFAEHLSNYRAVEELGTVAWFIHYIDEYSEETQIAVLKLLEFIVAGLSYIPKDELSSLVELLRGPISPSLASLVLSQISKFIQFNVFLRASLREAQLFDVITYLLSTEFDQIMQNSNRASTTQKSSLNDLYDYAISILIGMLDRMPENIRSFREAGGLGVLQKMLLNDNYREHALKVFQTIILQDTHSIDVNILIEILQTAPRSNISLKIAIFKALRNMFQLKESAKDAFREAGFMAAISIIINSPWPTTEADLEETEGGVDMMLQLFESLFDTLAGSLTNHPLNKSLLTKLIGATAITDALKVNGILRTPYFYHAFQCLLDFATERSLHEVKENNMMVFGKLTVAKNAYILNPHAFRFILMLLGEMKETFRYDMMRVFEYLSRLSPVNLEALASIQVVAYIYENFSTELANTTHPIHSTILRIVERLGCYRLSQHEWRTTLALLQSKEHQSIIHKFLVMAAKDGTSTPFVDMEPDSDCSIVSLHDKSWGSNLTGYSYGCWFYFDANKKLDSNDRSEHKLFDILSLYSDDKKSYLKISIREDGFLEVKTASNAKKVVFGSYVFQAKKWYNVVITHKKYRLQGSSMSLHVNGVLIESQKTPFVTYSSAGGTKMRGNVGKNPKNSETSLRMGSCFLYEDILGLNTIASIYVAGPSYSGYYQGNYVSSMHMLSEHLYTNFIKLLQNQGTTDNISPSTDIEAENALKVMAHPLSEDKFVFCFNPGYYGLRDIENSARDNSTSSGVFLETLHSDSGIPRVFVRNAFCCCPTALSDEILNCDGLGVVLALIERSESSEALQEALSLLANLMLDSPKILNEMDRLSAYDMVGSFLRRKGYFVNEAIHDLLWNMVLMGSRNGKELVTNLKACLCFLFDFEIWKKAPPHVQQRLFHKMATLISQGVYKRWNALRFDKVGIVHHLLHMLTHCPPIEIMDSIVDVIAAQLSEKMTIEHVTYLKEFLLLTLDSEHTLGGSTYIKPQVSERRRSLSSLTTLTLRRSSRRTPLTSFLRISSRNLLLKMLLDSVKSKSTNLDKLYRVVDFKWFYQFVNEKAHPVSAAIAIQLWCCVALYNPTNMNNDKMFAIMKQGLVPYCNQFDMYQALFCLTLSRYARFNDKSDNFEVLLKNNKEPKIAFPQVIPSILSMLKHNFNRSSVPHYDNLSVHSYFSEVGPMDAGKDKWKYFKLGMSSHPDDLVSTLGRESIYENFASDSAEPESFYNEHSVHQQELRQQLTRGVIHFLHTLHRTSPSFRIELRKSEILDDLVAVLFANATHTDITGGVEKVLNFDEAPQQSIFAQNDPINTQLFSLITDIIVSEFNSSGKGTNALHDVLSACPITASQIDCAAFRATVIENIMKYYSDEENFRITAENSKLATSVANFTMYVADMYKYGVIPEAKYIVYMGFIIDIVVQLNALEANAQKSKSKLERNFMQFTSMIQSATSGTTGINIDPLALTLKDITVGFRALNKMIVHLLTMYEDIDATLDVLDHMIRNNWLVTAFDSNNRERDFFICLCYILHNALVHQDERIRNRGIGCWKILISAQKSIADNMLISLLTYKNESNESVCLIDGFNLLLERDISIFMNWHSTNPVVVPFFESRIGTEARTLMEADKKSVKTAMASLFQKARSRSNSSITKKEKKALETYTVLSRECKHVFNTIKEQGDSAAKTKVEQDVIRYKFAFDQWDAFKRQLYMERAVWYDGDTVKMIIWALDSTEGPQRIRKKFEMMQVTGALAWTKKSQNIESTPSITVEKSEQNPQFLIDQYKKFEELQLSPKGLLSPIPQKNSSPHTETDNTIDSHTSDQDENSESNDHSDNTDALNESHDLNSETDNSETTFEEDMQEDLDMLDEEMGEYFKIRRLLEPGENMANSEIYNSLKVTGLDGQKGIIVLCQHNMYIIDNFMLTKDEKIIEVDGSHVTSATFDDIPQSPSSDTSTSGAPVIPISHHVIRISYSEITQVLRRRYLLRVTALEFFCEDGRNYFVVFEKSEMEPILDKVVGHSGAKNINKGPSQKHMTLLWQKGEISNFDYLMYLNTLAGRSYNDLTQYPVFPWILKDYMSEELDLNDPNVFRDLSRPMGAQTEERANQFRQRFNDWPVETGIPKFHYGSHYSSAGIVLHYLMRIEPFTTQAIELQGGKFDHADRMFHSVHDTWLSASTDYSMADVKELIPEFFFLPEFLTNTNDVDFGRRQNHTRVNNVVLPPWAKGDPFEFIRIHRLALESDYVSEHIHDWIDLIFGYKQKGKDAEDAINLYYYLTYEGAVDIDAITNEVDRQATIAQISNFGQTPHQIFTTPHPKRNAGQLSHSGPNVVAELLTNMKKPTTPGDVSVISYKLPLENKQLLYLSLDSIEGRICTSADVMFMNFTQSGEKSLKPRLMNTGTMMKTPQNCVGQIASSKSDVVVLKKNCFMWGPKGSKYFSYGHPDHSLRISRIGDDHHHARMTYENLHTSQISCATCTDDKKTLITGGDDSAVSVWKLERASSGRKRKVNLTLKKRLCGHCDTITCLSASTSFSILVSGSKDGACIVWDLNTLQYIRLLEHQAVSDRVCMDDNSISCIAISAHNGDIAVCLNNIIYLWSINGALLAKVDTRASKITAICLSNAPKWYNDNFIVTGHEDGSLKIWTYDFSATPDPYKLQEEYYTDSGPNGISTSSGGLLGSLSIKLHSTKHLNTSEVTCIYITEDLQKLYAGDNMGTVTSWEAPN